MIVAPSGAIFNYGASKQYNKRGSMDNIKSNKLNTHFNRGAENHNLEFNKHNIKLEKHNIKLVNVIFIIALSLFGLTSVSALTLLSSNSHADTTSATASVTVPDTCYLSSNIESGHEHTDTLSGGEYKANIGETTVSVVCNDRNGYSVYAIGCSGSDATNCSDINKTKLIGASTNLTIPTGLSTDGSTSNWAMKLTAVTGTFAPTILNGYNNYSLVPATTTKVATLTSDINVSNSSQFKTSYAVAVAPSQAADTYIGKVKYTVVHPNYTNSDGTRETYNIPVNFAGSGVSSVTITADGCPTRTVSTSGGTANLAAGAQYTMTANFTSGYEFVSWALNNANYGTLGSTSVNPTTFTPNTNSANAVITITGQEKKLYMWDASSADCGTTMYDNRDGTERAYTTAKIGELCWMTKNLMLGKSTTTALTSDTSNVRSSGYTLPASSTTGFWDSSTAYVYNAGDRSCSSSQSCYGYYSYVAACAGSNPSSGACSYDICPAGWRLPTQAELTTLKNSYSTGSALTGSPFLGVYAGNYGNSSFSNGGSGGYYRSSRPSGSSEAYYLNFFSSSADVYSYLSKALGFSVRCVAKS